MTQTQAPGVTLGPWQETANFADDSHRSHPLPSFAVGPFYYVHAKTNQGADDRIVYYAIQQVDGSLSPWSVALSDHKGGPHGFTAVATENTAYHFRNGHIAQYVIDRLNGRISEIKLLENPEFREPFSGNKYMWDTAVYIPSATGNSYVYHLGGFNMTTHSYNVDDVHRTTTPIAQENAYFQNLQGLIAPATNPSKAAFYKKSTVGGEGYIYMGDRNSSKIYRTHIVKDIEGSPNPWIDSGNSPKGNGNGLGDIFVIHDSLFAIRGSKVFKATINPTDGSLSSWDDSPPDLPEAQIDVNWHSANTEGASYGLIGDYVYVTGPKKVYYSKISSPNYKTFLVRIQGEQMSTPVTAPASTQTPAMHGSLP
ncbi:MAG: hypothetical protein GY759_23715 [Chloroflexi bacterium]|nr:hypothetical protein [Chloroflexota bacterium]